MHMPRNGFDNLAAVARLNYDDTSHHRERWPSLDWVWDELDMLRRWQDEAIDHDDHDALETERNGCQTRCQRPSGCCWSLSRIWSVCRTF